jgi:plasmid stabilization system protein ParE
LEREEQQYEAKIAALAVAAFRFSRRAESDLLSTGDYTLRTWGKAQAARYLGEFEVCCQTLSDNPGLGRLCDQVRLACLVWSMASTSCFTVRSKVAF